MSVDVVEWRGRWPRRPRLGKTERGSRYLASRRLLQSCKRFRKEQLMIDGLDNSERELDKSMEDKAGSGCLTLMAVFCLPCWRQHAPGYQFLSITSAERVLSCSGSAYRLLVGRPLVGHFKNRTPD